MGAQRSASRAGWSVQLVLVAALIVLAACGDSAGSSTPVTADTAPSPGVTNSTQPAPTTEPVTTTAPAPRVTTTTTRASTSTRAVPTSTTRPEPIPLLVGISIHVEGWQEESVDDNLYAVHRDAILEVARIAGDRGATFSFELSRPFVEGTIRRQDDVVDRLLDYGQAVGVHADLGGQPIAFEDFERQLAMMRIRLERLGADVTHVSGVCSEAPWVEAAIGAGYETVTGFVEYCLKSLDTLPAGYEHVASCTTPRDCHGTVPTDQQRKMRPWRTASAADWLTHDPAGELIMIAGDSGHSLQCMGEPTVGGCTLDDADAAAFAALIEEYLAAKRGPGLAVATVSWSIGALPPDGFTAALCDAVAPYVASGEVAWASIPEMAARFG